MVIYHVPYNEFFKIDSHIFTRLSVAKLYIKTHIFNINLDFTKNYFITMMNL